MNPAWLCSLCMWRIWNGAPISTDLIITLCSDDKMREWCSLLVHLSFLSTISSPIISHIFCISSNFGLICVWFWPCACSWRNWYIYVLHMHSLPLSVWIVMTMLLTFQPMAVQLSFESCTAIGWKVHESIRFMKHEQYWVLLISWGWD